MKKASLLIPLLLCSACIARHPVNNVSMIPLEGEPIPTLVGHASATTWFGTWTSGDASIEQAQKNGGITKVSSITRTTNNFLGLVITEQITVRGE